LEETRPLALQYQALIAADVKSDTHKLYDFGAFDAVGPAV